MERLFADLPEAVGNTKDLSDRLDFTLADLGYKFPPYPVPSGETMHSFLHKQTYEGALRRYVPLYDRARQQIERELALIEKLDLAGYFLIVWDLVEFCRRNGILAQGRGSAANSAVCYSLGITAVDPVGMDLLFERFLSEERGEWPDIDLDLPSGDDRERVIQYVYERYGKRGAAMTANVITYRGRSAARDVGKVLGIPPADIARLWQAVPHFEWKDPGATAEAQFAEAGFELEDRRLQKFYELYLAIQDLPRHLGQHSGGMVMCHGDLDAVVPLEPATMPGRVIVQWDKEDCADLGLIKVDLLGLGMMAVLEDSLEMIRDHYGEEVDLAQLAAGRPGGLRRASNGRHDRDVPGGKPRADVVPAAPAAEGVLRHRRAGGHHPPRPHCRQDASPLPAPASGARETGVPASVARAGAGPHARRAAVPGAVASHGDDRRRIYRRRGRRTPASIRFQTIGEAHARSRGKAAARHGPERHHRTCAGRHHSVHHVVRAVWLSRIARRQLRAHRLRERVPEMPLPRGFHGGDAEQSADGLLPSGDHRQRRAAARSSSAPAGRHAIRPQLHRGP